MIILDTNIISEMMKNIPSPSVMSWIDQQQITQLFITSITIAEIYYGLRAIPETARQEKLQNAFEKAIQNAFKYRTLSFDDNAAHHYGNLMSQRKRTGRPLSILDGQIAAIALAENATIATRNTRDFNNCGLDVINPFAC